MVQFNNSYWWPAAVAVVGLVIFTYFYYRRTIPPLKKSWRIGLGITRSLALVLLLLVLAETLLSFSPEIADPPLAVGLIDASSSMFARGDRTNLYERARDRWQVVAGHLPQEVETVPLFVAESLMTATAVTDSGGSATALGRALSSLKKRYETQNLTAVFLFSDGNNNLGADPGGAAAELGAPVITVGMGRPDTGLVPNIAAVVVDEIVLANNPFSIRVDVGAQGAGDLHLRLLRDNRLLEEKTVRIAAGGQRVAANFETSVPAAGIHNFRIEPSAMPEAGRSFFIKALKEKTRVLLYGFRPDWEFSFLRRALAGIPRLEIVPVLHGPQGRNLLENEPLTIDEWLPFDAIILVGPDERWLKSVWAPIVGQIRDSGIGIMVLLGENTFSRARPDLPYPLDFLLQIPVWKRGEFPLFVDGRFIRHPLLRLEETPDESRRVFESFPPFAAIWQFHNMKRRATIPLYYQPVDLNTPDKRHVPLVWTFSERGEKALLVNGGPLWRWSFNSSVEPDGIDYYRRFLEYAVRWLTVTEDLEKQRIAADKEIYASGEPVRLRGLLYDDGYNFLSRASVVARVWPDTSSAAADSATVFLPPGGGDFYEATLTGLPPGLYNYAGRAIIDNDTLVLTGGKLKVELVGLEKTAHGLDELQMREIAAESGGRYYHESEPIAVLDSLTFIARTYTIHREIEIWNQSWLLIAIIVLLSGEWFFRKRRQLL